jgi:hypothetical protein
MRQPDTKEYQDGLSIWPSFDHTQCKKVVNDMAEENDEPGHKTDCQIAGGRATGMPLKCW